MEHIIIAEYWMWTQWENWNIAKNLDFKTLNTISQIELSLCTPYAWFEAINEKVTVEILISNTPASECFSEDIWL